MNVNAIRTAVALIAMLIAIYYFSKRDFKLELEKRFFCIISFLGFLMICTFLSDICLFKDSIYFTASDEVGEQAEYSDVVIQKIVTDRMDREINDVKDGNWFYSGYNYVWLNQDRKNSDGRESTIPELTNSIRVNVPIGHWRKVVFAEKSSGYVLIHSQGKEYNVDTSVYKELVLPSSNIGLLVLDFIIKLCILAIVGFGILLMVYYYISKVKQSKYKNYIQGVSIVIILNILYIYGVQDKLRICSDGLSQIAYVSNSLLDSFKISTRSITDPFMYSIVSWVWYRLIPADLHSLLILPEFLSILSIFSIGYVATKWIDERVGIFSAIMLSLWPHFWEVMVFKNRYYALWLLLSIWLYDAYLDHYEERKWSSIYLSIMTVLTVATQYFTVLFVGMLFLIDLMLIMTKKRSIKYSRTYIIDVIVGSPFAIWFVTNFLLKRNGAEGKQLELPSLRLNELSIDTWHEMISYYTANSMVLQFLIIAGIVYIIIMYLRRKKERDIIFLCAGLGSILIGFFYGGYLASENAVGTNRYYNIILPLLIVLMAIGLNLIHLYIASKDVATILTCSIIVVLLLQSWQTVRIEYYETYLPRHNYEEAADWLSEQYDLIYKKDTVLVVNFNQVETQAWQEFFLNRKGVRPEINCVSSKNFDLEQLLAYKDVYFYGVHKKNITGFLKERGYEPAFYEDEQDIKAYYKYWQ